MNKIRHFVCLALSLLVLFSCSACNSYASFKDVYENGNVNEQIEFAIKHKLLTQHGFEEITNSKFIIKEEAHDIYEAYFNDICYDYYLSRYGVCGNIESEINNYDIRITIYLDKELYWIELKDEKSVYSALITFSLEPVEETENIFDLFVPIEEISNEQSYNKISQCVSQEDIQKVINNFEAFTNDLMFEIYDSKQAAI